MSELNETYAAFVAKLFNRTGDLSKDFTHACLGIYTEVGELFDSKEILEAILEAGDLMFFGQALDMVIDEFVTTVLTQYTPDDYMKAWTAQEEATLNYARSHHHDAVLRQFGTDLLNASKRWVGYGKVPTLEDVCAVRCKARVIIPLALAYSMVNDRTPEEFVRANMAKLLKRYPGGEFDAYRAVNRDTEAEREAAQQA